MTKLEMNFKCRTGAMWGLLLSLITVLLVPMSAQADSTPPSEPASLKSLRYSSTAGEIIWTSATDDTFVVGYRVIRDGVSLGIKDARSLYEPSLVPGRAYEYSVSAVDLSGNEGAPLVVKISGVRGEQLTGTASGGGTTGGSTGGSSSGDDGLVLRIASSRVELREGDRSGASVGVSVERRLADKRTVTLSLVPQSENEDQNLSYRFSTTNLQPQQSGSVLSLWLDVGIAPLLAHERQFKIVADDGVSKASIDVIVGVTPTSAPDVYLLIGQSNMEGYSEVGSKQSYSGGLDERVDRIKQLNVQPNSKTIFTNESLFTNEGINVSTPLFVPAEDPLHEPRFVGIEGKGATFVGLGLTFAKEAMRNSTADTYLVPAAWGATGFCANSNGNLAWNAEPTGNRFLGGTLLADRALTRLNMTLRETGGILRGILWHQGGADSNNTNCANSYAENLTKLVKRLRQQARVDVRGSAVRSAEGAVPFIVATQSKGDDSRAKFSVFSASKLKVDDAHRTVSSYIPYSDFVNNDDLVPPNYPCGQVSCVHFGAVALREQGRRFYAALKRIWSSADAYHY